MTNLKMVVGIGIDVSKAELVVALRTKTKNEIIKIKNQQAEIKKFSWKITGYTGKIVMESTSHYHLLAALSLSKAQLDVRVINPLLAKKYTTASVRKVKSDPADSCNLAEMAEREQNLPATFKLEKREIQLKQKLNLLQNIEIQSLKATQREFIATQKELQLAKSPVKNNLAKALKDLLKAKKQLETDLEKAVQDPEKQAALTNIPGISSLGASLILNFLDLNCLSVKQWIAYTGLDISIRESGTWKGKGKLTKRGNAFLRKRCVAMAWGAIMHNKYFKALYTELRQRKRSYKEALCIIARKILRIAFTILKQNIPYNENILCQQN